MISFRKGDETFTFLKQFLSVSASLVSELLLKPITLYEAFCVFVCVRVCVCLEGSLKLAAENINWRLLRLVNHHMMGQWQPGDEPSSVVLQSFPSLLPSSGQKWRNCISTEVRFQHHERHLPICPHTMTDPILANKEEEWIWIPKTFYLVPFSESSLSLTRDKRSRCYHIHDKLQPCNSE